MTLYEQTIKKWGKTLQMAMLAEECSELSSAALKMIRGREVNIAEEIADVLIMIEQWYVMFDGLEELVKQARIDKLARLRKRLGITLTKGG